MPGIAVMKKYASEFFDFSQGDIRAYFKKAYGKFYFDAEIYTKFSKHVYEKYGQDNKINKIFSVYKTYAKSLEDRYFDSYDGNLINLSDKDLVYYFKSLYKMYNKFWQYSLFIDSFDPGYDLEETNKIKERYGFSNDEVVVLTTPEQLTFNNEKQLDLLKIIKPIIKKKLPTDKRDSFLKQFVKSDPEIQRHKRQFDYTKSSYTVVSSITEAELVEEIKKYLDQSSFYRDELDKLDNFSKRQSLSVKNTLKTHKLSKNPFSFFQILTFWREDRKKFNLMGIYALDEILQIIEKRTGISKKYLQYLFYEEVENVLGGLISRSVLEGRYNKPLMIVTEGDKYKIIEGDEAESLHEELEDKLVGEKNQISIPGQTASQGYAKGIARIILTEDDFNKFNNGEILVTGMTRPEFVPLMKKSAAIVTNEGGITCHAAIVSRELGKPCIIGTQVATQMIKDGDLIEVRANHGTVRILK